MKVQFDGIWLTGETMSERASLIAPSGERLFEVVPLVRAEYAALFNRGNKTMQLPLQIMRRYAGFSAAFIAQFQFLSLPGQGTLRIEDVFAETPVSLEFPGAILTACPAPTWNGVANLHRYNFQVAAMNIVEGPIPEMERTGILDLDESATGGVVEFSTALLGGTENVIVPQPAIIKPSAEADDFFVTSVFEVTTGGFKFALSGALTAGGYQLAWLAKNQNV